MADRILVGGSQKLRKTAVDRAECAIQRNCEGYVVQRINQLFKAALGACYDLAKLINLLVGRGCPLLHAADQAFEFGNPLSASIGKASEEDDDEEQSNGNQDEV